MAKAVEIEQRYPECAWKELLNIVETFHAPSQVDTLLLSWAHKPQDFFLAEMIDLRSVHLLGC